MRLPSKLGAFSACQIAAAISSLGEAPPALRPDGRGFVRFLDVLFHSGVARSSSVIADGTAAPLTLPLPAPAGQPFSTLSGSAPRPICSMTRSAAASCGFEKCSGAWGKGEGRGNRPLKLRRVLCGLLLRRFLKIRVLYALADKLAFARGMVLLDQPSRLNFCVILSRGFIGSFKCFHLQSAPLQGRRGRPC